MAVCYPKIRHLKKTPCTTVYERTTKVVPKNVDDEMSSKDLEVADVIYRCPSLNEDLYSAFGMEVLVFFEEFWGIFGFVLN